MFIVAVQEEIVRTIGRTELSWRADMCSRILLTGRCGALPGLASRLQGELTANAEASTATVAAPYAVKHTRACATDAWRGAAACATLRGFDELWFTKAEYEEVGVGRSHTRCL